MTYRTILFCVLGAVLLLVPPAAASGATQDDCMVVAYTFDGHSHYSMVQSDSLVIGTLLIIEEDCPDDFSIRVNGYVVATIDGVGSISVNAGVHDIRLESDSTNVSWNNVTFYNSRSVMTMVENPQFASPDSEWMSPDEISNKESLVAFGTGLIVWALVTSILWRLVNSFIDKSLCEEVVS